MIDFQNNLQQVMSFYVLFEKGKLLCMKKINFKSVKNTVMDTACERTFL